MDVPGAIRVQVRPHIDEVLDLVVCDSAAVFPLDYVEALQGDSDEEVDEDQAHYEHVQVEEETRYTIAASYGHSIVVNVILISCISDALEVHALGPTEVVHDFVPAFASHNSDQSQERVAERLEVAVVVECSRELDVCEQSVAGGREDVDHDDDETADVDECGDRMEERVENNIEPLGLLQQPEHTSHSQDSEGGQLGSEA
mmetsp:Transcript_40272/g.61451  ORF Transcript_40272/g.61451 Transcript_40272/m.61451 type:complete len:201 (+) Transcript_40272:2895-3497(+)